MTLNIHKPVKVYRKLAGKGYRKGRVLYSIMQDGRVRAVRERVILSCAKFIVNEAGRQRVLEEKRKNVHAFVEGYLVSREFIPDGFWGDENGSDLNVPIRYNPYKYGYFYSRSAWGNDLRLYGANAVLFNERGVTASYVY